MRSQGTWMQNQCIEQWRAQTDVCLEGFCFWCILCTLTIVRYHNSATIVSAGIGEDVLGRRDFLRKSGIAAAGGFAALTLGFGKEAQAGEYSTENLPPGFANSPFEQIREAAAVLYGHHSSEGISHLGEFLVGGTIYPNSGRIEFYSDGNGIGTLDPAYYMLLRLHMIQTNESNGRLTAAATWGKWEKEDVEDKNPAIYWFHLGLLDYFKKWVYGKNVNERTMENNFLKAIFIAGEKGPYPTGVQSGAQKANDFQNSLYAFTGDWKNFNFTFPGEREGVIDKLLSNIKIMNGHDHNSLNPNNSYFRETVVVWSAFILRRHFLNLGWRKSITGDRKIQGQQWFHMLRPLEIMGIRGNKISGPPFYYDSEGGIKI